MTIQQILNQICERADKATPGPWELHHLDPGNPYLYGVNGCTTEKKDAEFIAASRTDVPKLVEALERAMEALENYACNGTHEPGFGCDGCAGEDAITEVERILQAQAGSEE